MKLDSIQIYCAHTRVAEVASLVPNPRNPNRHPESQIALLSKIIRHQGWRNPITVSKRSGFIVAGHGRLDAAKLLKLETVPVDDQEFATEADEWAHLLADNRLAELAETDGAVLKDVLLELDTGAFDMDLTGFDAKELERVINFYSDGELRDAEPQTDKAEELNQKWGVETGDLWTIGKHRLLCGDATNNEDVTTVMDGQESTAIVSDPPYGIGFDYASHDDARSKWFALMNTVVPMMRARAKLVIIPACGLDRLGWWYMNHKPDWLIAWYKGSPGHRSHVGFNDWEAHIVWGKPDSPMHDYFQTKCGFEIEGHPCPKTIEWATWLIERSAARLQIVLDPFLGSGTTMVAAENLGRICYGIEIHPPYCAVILERMHTAFPAIRIEKA